MGGQQVYGQIVYVLFSFFKRLICYSFFGWAIFSAHKHWSNLPVCSAAAKAVAAEALAGAVVVQLLRAAARLHRAAARLHRVTVRRHRAVVVLHRAVARLRAAVLRAALVPAARVPAAWVTAAAAAAAAAAAQTATVPTPFPCS